MADENEAPAAAPASAEVAPKKPLPKRAPVAAPVEEADPFALPATKLDRKRPFGIVMGESRKRYFQDGRYFDHNGNVIEEG